jgi:hypothetical protein
MTTMGTVCSSHLAAARVSMLSMPNASASAEPPPRTLDGSPSGSSTFADPDRMTRPNEKASSLARAGARA